METLGWTYDDLDRASAARLFRAHALRREMLRGRARREKNEADRTAQRARSRRRIR